MTFLMRDGRKIMRGAFKDCDGTKIPVCKSFMPNVNEVLGNATLIEKEDGVYYTAEIELAEDNEDRLVCDCIRNSGYRFGMFANQLKEKKRVIQFGVIRYMSLTAPCDAAGCIISLDGEKVYFQPMKADNIESRQRECTEAIRSFMKNNPLIRCRNCVSISDLPLKNGFYTCSDMSACGITNPYDQFCDMFTLR